MILKCLKEIKINRGRALLSETLVGRSLTSRKIQDTKAYQNPYYGVLSQYSQKEIIRMIDYLILEGYITKYLSSYKHDLIKLTDKGETAIFEEENVQIKVPKKSYTHKMMQDCVNNKSSWSSEDDRKLEFEYKQGESIGNLANMFNCTTGQIRTRIKKISRGRFCFRCLAKVEKNDSFCNECGVRLKR